MPRLTLPRLSVLGMLERGACTFPVILTVLGISPEYSRGDYARAHRIIMDLVRDGIVVHQKNRRHHSSMFSLTPAGQALVAEYRRKHEQHLQLLSEVTLPAGTALPPDPAILSSPLPTPVAPLRSPPEDDAEIKCPECGESVSLTRAKTLLEGGSKVTCRCTNDLTVLARNALSRSEED